MSSPLSHDASPTPPSPLTSILTRDPTSRLSIPFPLRLPLSTTLAFLTGFGLGSYQGSLTSGLRFRAENAHRTPTSQTGWYLYHKSKNYHMALGGIREGLLMGLKQSFWVGTFVGLEEFVDRGRAGVVRQWRGERERKGEVRGYRDFVSSVLAGLGTAGGFSVWNGFRGATTVRLLKLGGKVGLGFGVLQDVVGVLRGRRVWYVERLFGRGKRREGASGEGAVGVAAAAA